MAQKGLIRRKTKNQLTLCIENGRHQFIICNVIEFLRKALKIV